MAGKALLYIVGLRCYLSTVPQTPVVIVTACFRHIKEDESPARTQRAAANTDDERLELHPNWLGFGLGDRSVNHHTS